MLIKILGGIDLVVGLLLVFGLVENLPSSALLPLGLIMLAKSSLGMLKDFGSWVDVLVGIVLLSSIIFNLPWIIGFLVGIFVLQKGIFSFF